MKSRKPELEEKVKAAKNELISIKKLTTKEFLNINTDNNKIEIKDDNSNKSNNDISKTLIETSLNFIEKQNNKSKDLPTNNSKKRRNKQIHK